MLSISTPQFSNLGDGIRARSAARMVEHVQRHFPRPAQLAGDAAVRRLVDRCFMEAMSLELVGERDLFYLLSLQLYFGAGFRHDRQNARFAAILERRDVATPTARIGRCWREGMAFYDQLAGPDARHLDVAIQRLAGRRLSSLVADDSPLNSAQAQVLLAEIWPEKHAVLRQLDPEAMPGLLAQVAALAQQHGIAQRGAARVLLLLSFVFGTGFGNDPMLAPLGQVLAAGAGMNALSVIPADDFLRRLTDFGA